MQNSEVNKRRMEIVKENYDTLKSNFDKVEDKIFHNAFKLCKTNAAFFCGIKFNPECFSVDLNIKNSVDMSNILAQQENILVTPGYFVNEERCFRVFLMSPDQRDYTECVERLTNFCKNNGNN